MIVAARLLALAAGVALCAAAGVRGPTPRSRAALPLAQTAGRGAAVPFDEYEAEDGETTGTVIGPDTRFGTLAAEASGRRAVRLSAPAQHLRITLARAANAVVVRYAIPDTADGHSREGVLALRSAGRLIARLPVTSRYGWFYGRYPFSNRPADGRGHHGFDHVRMRLGRTLPAGTTVELAIASDLPWIGIDVVDFEQVAPPRAAPPNAISLRDAGADPTGARDAAPALRRALARARATRRPLWIPPGDFRVDGHVEIDRVAIQGAGMWWTTLHGTGLGLYGRKAPGGSHRVAIRDLSIVGEVDERRDEISLSGIGGAFNDSVIERVWLQHHKVGAWLDGPMRGLRLKSLRIFDMTADGVNFHQGVTDSSVEDSFVRGTGDDGLAAWSHHQRDARLRFARNTVIAPVLANGIALYGGRDIAVTDNLIADTLTEGGGIHIGNRFDAVPVAGRIAIHRNILVRSGSIDPNWRFGVGALWFYALDRPLAARIDVRKLKIVQPVAEPILLLGKGISGVELMNVEVRPSTDPFVVFRARAGVSLLGSGSHDKAVFRECEAGRYLERRIEAEGTLYSECLWLPPSDAAGR